MFGQVVATKAAALVAADEMQTRHRGGVSGPGTPPPLRHTPHSRGRTIHINPFLHGDNFNIYTDLHATPLTYPITFNISYNP